MSLENKGPFRAPDSSDGSGSSESNEPELRLQSEVLNEIREEIDSVLDRNDFRKGLDYTIVKENTLKDYIDIQIRPGLGNTRRRDYETRELLWGKIKTALLEADEFPKTAVFEPSITLEYIRLQLKKEIEQRRTLPKKQKSQIQTEEKEPSLEKEVKKLSRPEILRSIQNKIIDLLHTDLQLVYGEDFDMNGINEESLELELIAKYKLRSSAPKIKLLHDYLKQKFNGVSAQPYFPVRVGDFDTNTNSITLGVIEEYVREVIEQENQE